jgi:Na+-translocating ferredoxin:NAD+ oxidoreductase RnfG subunit
MAAVSNSTSIPWGRLIPALAYALLVVAFVIGQIAAQTDYEALLQKQMPDVELTRSQVNKELPIVYRMLKDDEESPDVVVMAEGEGYGGPLVVGVRARRTEDGARVNEILLLDHKETPSFVQRIENKYFFRHSAYREQIFLPPV